jgi:hypothetical protein
MANPNIINIGSLYGKTAVASVTANVTTLITNSSGSGKVIKVSSLYISNSNSTSTSYVSLDLFRSGAAYYIMFQTPIPVGSTIDAINKHLYLEEGDSLRISSLTNNDVKAVSTYEEIS